MSKDSLRLFNFHSMLYFHFHFSECLKRRRKRGYLGEERLRRTQDSTHFLVGWSLRTGRIYLSRTSWIYFCYSFWGHEMWIALDCVIWVSCFQLHWYRRSSDIERVVTVMALWCGKAKRVFCGASLSFQNKCTKFSVLKCFTSHHGTFGSILTLGMKSAEA